MEKVEVNIERKKKVKPVKKRKQKPIPKNEKIIVTEKREMKFNSMNDID